MRRVLSDFDCARMVLDLWILFAACHDENERLRARLAEIEAAR